VADPAGDVAFDDTGCGDAAKGVIRFDADQD
jgi:hypothetical protein